jgi:hypothetical protein
MKSRDENLLSTDADGCDSARTPPHRARIEMKKIILTLSAVALLGNTAWNAALLGVLLCSAGCGPKPREFKRIQIGKDTYLVVYQKVDEGGFWGTSVQTSLAMKWPNSSRPEHITELCSPYGTKTEVRLLSLESRYILVYGDSLYYRDAGKRQWAWWLLRSRSFSPGASVASWLRTWFQKQSRHDFTYLPEVKDVSEGGME